VIVARPLHRGHGAVVRAAPCPQLYSSYLSSYYSAARDEARNSACWLALIDGRGGVNETRQVILQCGVLCGFSGEAA
jgi:hypothetical protein